VSRACRHVPCIAASPLPHHGWGQEPMVKPQLRSSPAGKNLDPARFFPGTRVLEPNQNHPSIGLPPLQFICDHVPATWPTLSSLSLSPFRPPMLSRNLCLHQAHPGQQTRPSIYLGRLGARSGEVVPFPQGKNLVAPQLQA
jgi:hypothetical protein